MGETMNTFSYRNVRIVQLQLAVAEHQNVIQAPPTKNFSKGKNTWDISFLSNKGERVKLKHK